jgi:hypothetical protein
MKRLRMVAAAFGILLVTTPASGEGSASSSFQAFEGRTDAFAAGLSSKQLSAAPVPIEAFLTRTRTEVNSQPRAQAYAGVLDVPLGELASMFGFPGKLPNYCYADYPGEPDNKCAGDRGVTHAEGDGFNLDSTRAESSVSAARHADQQLTVGTSYSRGSARIVEGVLQTATEVVLQQVKIGDVLAFEQLRSSASASTNGQPGGAKAASALTASGVTVMGQRIPVPDQLDLSKLVKDVLAPLTDQFAAKGVTVKVVSPPENKTSSDGREALASVSGLLIESIEPATQNRVAFSLGVARASAVAVPASSFDEGPLPDSGPLPPLEPPLSPLPEEPPAAGTGAEFVVAPVSDASTSGPAGRIASALPALGSSSPAASPSSQSAPASDITDPGASVAAPTTGTAPPTGRLSPALASEVIGRRVADKLPAAYGAAAAVIVILGLLAFRLAAR